MIVSQSARWPGRGLHIINGKGRPNRAIRHLSIVPSRPILSTKLDRPLSRKSQLSWRATAHSILAQSCFRFASTTPNPPVEITSPAHVPFDPIAAPSDSFSSSTFDSIAASDLTPMVPQIGYLKSLGLDYGWGPTAMVEWFLEHVHVYSGLPWWSSIIISAVAVRIAMLPLYRNAIDMSGRMAVLEPHMKPIKERINAAQAAKDQAATLAAVADLKATYKAGGVKLYQMFMPLIQVPLGFGTFRLMRAMGDLPVPGLEDGGLLWVKDLTVPDPYYILPIATGCAVYYTFKRGGEMGTSSMMNPQMRNLFQYGLPTMSGFIMLFWPGCMQLTFFTTGMLSLLQAMLFSNNAARKFIGVQPLPPPRTSLTGASATPYTGTMTYQSPTPTSPAPPEKTGMIGGAIADLKGAAKQIAASAKKTAGQIQGTKTNARLSAGELRQAKVYEERRKREIEMEKLERKGGRTKRKAR